MLHHLQNPSLWQRLQAYQIGPQQAELSFTQRLARENAWSPAYAERVLLEYKKFCYLAMTEGTQVTPSHDVDQAWHLHLTYTRDYWQRFCPDILGAELHHGPTEGGRSQDQHYRQQYEYTLIALERNFGASDEQVWPSCKARFAHAQHWQFTNKKLFWPKCLERALAAARQYGMIGSTAMRLAVISATLAGSLAVSLALVSVANAFELSPLTQWHAGAFLGLFLCLIMACALINFLQRRLLSRSLGSRAPLKPVEVAMLCHSYQRAKQTAIAELLQAGVLVLQGRDLRDTGQPAAIRSQSLVHEQVLVNVADATRRSEKANAQVAPGVKILPPMRLSERTVTSDFVNSNKFRDALIASGIYLPAQDRVRIVLWQLLPWVMLFLFGVTRIGLAISWEKPFAFLVIMMIAAFPIMLICLARSPKACYYPQQQLNALRARKDLWQVRQPQNYAMACALFGTSALAGTSLAAYAERELEVSTSTTSSSSGCGSSGGGDAGGDGGSGCSGCGGCGGGGGD